MVSIDRCKHLICIHSTHCSPLRTTHSDCRLSDAAGAAQVARRRAQRWVDGVACNMRKPMDTYPTREGRLITVSNRLPIVLTGDGDDEWQVEPGDGGLITALAPVLRDRGGVWIGWPGTVEEEHIDLDTLLARATSDAGYTLRPVGLTATERDKFYLG